MRVAIVPLSAVLAACVPVNDARSPGPVSGPLPTVSQPPAEPGQAACWAEVEPADTARDLTTVSETDARGSDLWFEVLCPEALTPSFLATLQRALAARGLYDGAITGRFDAATGAAVRAYQTQRGIDDARLARASAERLGLVVIDRGQMAGESRLDPV